ncbi:MAG: gliding motility-associated C-terminal domain-containing protein, partial [Draconibacterium sp.]|nr:gliding motility-associated C-terminal domain-containing protein [Draconibacterium sp.]
IHIPNGFSPGNDGKNDFFEIVMDCGEGFTTFGEEYPTAKMLIYNRWGNLVYEQVNYGNESLHGADAWWYGTSQHDWTVGDEKVPVGTYVYILIVGDGSVEKGTVFVNY